MGAMTMERAIRRGRCSKCRCRIRDDVNANYVMKAGYLTGFICSRCQTDEDRAEAAINEATLDYSTMATDAFGRVTVKSKAV